MQNCNFIELLNSRILVLDGAMGTEIQKLNLTEHDFRGDLFTNSTKDLKGNNDILVLTQPEGFVKKKISDKKVTELDVNSYYIYYAKLNEWIEKAELKKGQEFMLVNINSIEG